MALLPTKTLSRKAVEMLRKASPSLLALATAALLLALALATVPESLVSTVVSLSSSFSVGSTHTGMVQSDGGGPSGGFALASAYLAAAFASLRARATLGFSRNFPVVPAMILPRLVFRSPLPCTIVWTRGGLAIIGLLIVCMLRPWPFGKVLAALRPLPSVVPSRSAQEKGHAVTNALCPNLLAVSSVESFAFSLSLDDRLWELACVMNAKSRISRCILRCLGSWKKCAQSLKLNRWGCTALRHSRQEA